jgi:hypothetical protein
MSFLRVILQEVIFIGDLLMLGVLRVGELDTAAKDELEISLGSHHHVCYLILLVD